ncbi:MAG TPA: cytochrome c biogenesis protein CcdA [Acidimicrobiales bacterium]|nr:cytochrome c biogenesis protein CcdA [Acidimicrobiales bacterium]
MGTSIGYLAAFGGGVVSFASPCVMPIVPAYLSVITGLDITEAGPADGRSLGRIARDTGLFVAGFTAVFVLLGLTASAVGQAALRNHELLTRVMGGAVTALGLFLAGSLVLRLPRLYGEARFHVVPARLGPFAAPVAGAAFGFGWTPCIGPVLASVLTVAATRGSTGEGAGLLFAYGLGLGVPFLVAGLAFGRLAGTFRWVRSHLRGLTMLAAVMIVGFGVLLMLDRLTWVTTGLETALRHIGLGRLVTLG